MSIIKFTPEQHDSLDYIIENDGIVLISARAGAGKSFLAEQIARALNPITALYTAFNKAIVQEGDARFEGTPVICKTFHALALSYVRKYINTRNIEEITYSSMPETLPYRDKYSIIDGVNQFCVSSSVDMFEFFEEWFKEEEKKEILIEHSITVMEEMIEGTRNPTFNFLLKYFHLLLYEETEIVYFDLVLLDEINDTTAVALEIFKLLKAPKKVGLGETSQAIYDFLNLVDGFEELKDAPVMELTQSFRCSVAVAGRIEKFMRTNVDKDFSFKGTEDPVRNGKTLYCTNTNARIVLEIWERLKMNKGFMLLRDVKEIFAYPLAIYSASRGKEVYHKKYKFLEEEYENFTRSRRANQSFLTYLQEHVGDQETESAVNLLLTISRKNGNIFDIYKQAKEAPVDVKYVIATVFTSKGLEYETVYIADDLNNRIDGIRQAGGIKNKEHLTAFRCYYVACSRCGVDLINATAL